MSERALEGRVSSYEDAMSRCAYGVLTGVAALSVFCLVDPAAALTMKQCSEKYKSANADGAVAGMSWNDFRKAECGADATMAVKKTAAPAKTAAATGPSAKECSALYKDAKKAGTLGGMTWNEFRSAGCVAKTAAAPTAPPAKQEAARTPPAEKSTRVSEQECSSRYQAAKSAGTLGGMTWNEFRSNGCPERIARSGSMTPTMGSIFPTAIAKKYAGRTVGRARLLTCRDQYQANKAAGTTQPKWTQKGGGYYSECNKRLSQQ